MPPLHNMRTRTHRYANQTKTSSKTTTKSKRSLRTLSSSRCPYKKPQTSTSNMFRRRMDESNHTRTIIYTLPCKLSLIYSPSPKDIQCHHAIWYQGRLTDATHWTIAIEQLFFLGYITSSYTTLFIRERDSAPSRERGSFNPSAKDAWLP